MFRVRSFVAITGCNLTASGSPVGRTGTWSPEGQVFAVTELRGKY